MTQDLRTQLSNVFLEIFVYYPFKSLAQMLLKRYDYAKWYKWRRKNSKPNSASVFRILKLGRLSFQKLLVVIV